ncbi:MAG: hypothetical protein OEQ74_02995, partial [Gammaproteobacteria bacterium]|nr:hypothetical protein [Gammaproteobacteria bacterium]
MVQAEELNNNAFSQLVMLPDGSVFHLMNLHLAALHEIYEPGDTLVYSAGGMIVRRNTTPSALLLEEPLATGLIGPALFAGINVANEVAILNEQTGYFFSSFPGFPYSASALDGSSRLIYVGSIVQPYATYQPVSNPFQPDSDADAAPDAADNCIYLPNGPGLPDAGENSQLDTNDDGIGNRCDPDIVGASGDATNNCLVDFFDVAAIKAAFLTGPAAVNWN